MEPPSSPPPQQPSPKKLKMSTTTSDDETTAAAANANSFSVDRKPRYKRRKVAIFFAYCGVGYQGMQKNPGAKTIEGDLEEALFLAGAVPEMDRGHPKRYDWARSARTDKGVSAVGQVVSGRFYVDPPGLVERLNSILPEQFRVFGYKRVTPSFSAKKFCDRRKYVYLLPVFALDPCAHRDRESVLASLGSENELVKCLECPERGRKVEGVMGNKRNLDAKACNLATADDSTDAIVDQDSSENGCNLGSGFKGDSDVESVNGTSNDSVEALASENSVLPKVENAVGLGQEDDVSDVAIEHVADVVSENGNGEDKYGKERSKFCYGEKEKERFNRILSSFVGTHNFYNFTTRIKAEDPSCHRFIVSFEANTVVTVEGMDFVKCEVVGQSFMLHQIRKMMGLAVAVMRNCAPESLLEYAFQKGVSITVPTAPEVGLYLDECYFTSYNNKWKDTHEEVSMKDYAEEAEAFKMKHIYSHIASTERKYGNVGLWLHSLNCRNYPDLRGVDPKVAADTPAEAKDIETIADTNSESNYVGAVTDAYSEPANIGIADAKAEANSTEIGADMNSAVEKNDA
uniref:Pseudouridine synthase I TruA alpha/beta domain-containing protein n=1 Tax=Kalanchoe fedtschenkoi TaxID=63787 RepID=A0A7N0R9W3_KALFE